MNPELLTNTASNKSCCAAFRRDLNLLHVVRTFIEIKTSHLIDNKAWLVIAKNHCLFTSPFSFLQKDTFQSCLRKTAKFSSGIYQNCDFVIICSRKWFLYKKKRLLAKSATMVSVHEYIPITWLQFYSSHSVPFVPSSRNKSIHYSPLISLFSSFTVMYGMTNKIYDHKIDISQGLKYTTVHQRSLWIGVSDDNQTVSLGYF